MNYRQLGRTGLYVSELCFGAMTFGGEGYWQAIGQQGQDEANKLVGKCLDAGVNFFDTADIYSFGASETILGKALGAKRSQVVLATKVRGRMSAGVNDIGLSRGHIMDSVHNSLRRLGTDYIDLYQIHGYDAVTPLDETLRALDDLVRQGKVRYLGASNLAAWQLMKALGISESRHLSRFESLQAYYSIAGRDLERELVPLMNDQRLGLMVWSPLAGGFLSGKYRRGAQGPEGARRASFDFPPINRERAYDVIDVMDGVAKEHQTSVARVALAWLLHQQHVTTVIIGAKTEAQLDDNLAATTLKLSAEQLAKLDAVSKLTPEYPAWMLERQGVDRVPVSK
ncbi:aldo/keto reductase [Corallococcus sp. H22C18031201]|uniref:aldo/keto reductase n=1 Tax=Citreicoccus inhibens TaxID=2849499 RepID=UPI000E70A27C|nr:aldo/keto reductase [Citreicoccus inhibens]MBU8897199.1 aldo/keto reductase [Citreicoccus inhibens]RJS21234.1 aldo/keto reductase [Corallococcus sp. H22C18031201]